MALRPLLSLDRRRGFTLLEVMVALVVFALAASVLLVTDGRALKQTARVQDKITASWLADYTLNQMHSKQAWPNIGKSSRSQIMAGRDWTIRQKVVVTSQEGLRRIDLAIYPGKIREGKDAPRGSAIFELTGYVRKPEQ